MKKPGKENVAAPKLRYLVVVSVKHVKLGHAYAQALIEVDAPLDRWSRIEDAQRMTRKVVAIIRGWKVDDIADLFFMDYREMVRE